MPAGRDGRPCVSHSSGAGAIPRLRPVGDLLVATMRGRYDAAGFCRGGEIRPYAVYSVRSLKPKRVGVRGVLLLSVVRAIPLQRVLDLPGQQRSQGPLQRQRQEREVVLPLVRRGGDDRIAEGLRVMPPNLHAAVTVPRLRARKHASVEKPLTITVSDATELIETAR